MSVDQIREICFHSYRCALSIFAGIGIAQSSYQPSPENLQARREFQDMKFGMFIHWGVYSVLGDGEWVFHNRKLEGGRVQPPAHVLRSRKIRRARLGLARQSPPG